MLHTQKCMRQNENFIGLKLAWKLFMRKKMYSGFIAISDG